ncbi:hypothetical protein, partial [Halomonas sp. AOP43-D1-4]
ANLRPSRPSTSKNGVYRMTALGRYNQEHSYMILKVKISEEKGDVIPHLGAYMKDFLELSRSSAARVPGQEAAPKKVPLCSMRAKTKVWALNSKHKKAR